MFCSADTRCSSYSTILRELDSKRLLPFKHVPSCFMASVPYIVNGKPSAHTWIENYTVDLALNDVVTTRTVMRSPVIPAVLEFDWAFPHRLLNVARNHRSGFVTMRLMFTLWGPRLAPRRWPAY
jgi:hypothetical protein